MRLYSTICSAIEAWAERTRSEGIENEFENADWTSSSPSLDD